MIILKGEKNLKIKVSTTLITIFREKKYIFVYEVTLKLYLTAL